MHNSRSITCGMVVVAISAVCLVGANQHAFELASLKGHVEALDRSAQEVIKRDYVLHIRAGLDVVYDLLSQRNSQQLDNAQDAFKRNFLRYVMYRVTSESQTTALLSWVSLDGLVLKSKKDIFDKAWKNKPAQLPFWSECETLASQYTKISKNSDIVHAIIYCLVQDFVNHNEDESVFLVRMQGIGRKGLGLGFGQYSPQGPAFVQSMSSMRALMHKRYANLVEQLGL